MSPTVRVCFVCLGNICRSPTAEGILRHLLAEAGLADRVQVDSAGTGSWHAGEPPDPRAREEAERRGVTLTGQARRFQPSDFDRFDLVLALDTSNEADLLDLAPDGAAAAKVRLLRAFDPQAGPGDRSVPDPYGGGPDGFARVFDQLERACRGLLDHLRAGGPGGAGPPR